MLPTKYVYEVKTLKMNSCTNQFVCRIVALSYFQ